MTVTQQIITIALMAASVMFTRAFVFLVFSRKTEMPRFVTFLGKWLPSAVFGMLCVYCVKDVDFIHGVHGAPQLLGIAACVSIHLLFRNMLLTIAGGTAFYMLLLHFAF